MDTNTYKKTHQPKALTENDSGKPHQGVYVPKHPEKVIGGEIIYRSSWELAFARWCDDNPAVIEWGSEPCSVEYRNPAGVNFDTCKRLRLDPMNPVNWPLNNYYPDFYVCLRNDDDVDGTDVKRLIIEIKPKAQTERPIAPASNAKLQEQKRYVNAVKTYLQNRKKWEAAIAWCNAKNYEFKVYTEDTLSKIGII